MKLKQKMLTGVAIVLGILFLGTNVNAAEFTSRILNPNEFTLATLAGIFSKGEPISQLTPEENAILQSLNQGNSVGIWKEDVESWENIFCIDSNIKIPNRGSLNEAPQYKKDEEKTYTNDAIAYILSYPRIPSDLGNELREQTIQVALWLVGLNSQGNHNFDPTIGQALAEEAKAFEEFRKNYGEGPIKIETEITTRNNIVGPFIIKYPMTYCNTTMFGHITEVNLYDVNGKIIDKSKWTFTDSDGNVLKNKVGNQEYLYPTSEQEFYIKVDGNVSGKVNMDIKFNNLQATGTILKLKGTYKPLYTGDWYGKCPTHLAMLENCGDSYNGTKYAGYKITTQQVVVNCGESYKKVLGTIPENLKSSANGTAPKRNIYESQLRAMKGFGIDIHPNKNPVKCGESYVLLGVNGNVSGAGTAYCSNTYCRGQKMTQYNFSECPGKSFTGTDLSVLCSNCANVWAEILEPCGEPTGEHEDKEGQTHINAACGYKYSTDEEEPSQPLAIGIGERTNSEVTLSFEFDVATIDLSLRKFITATNEEEITNRIPQVDVTPLKNGETTAKYNHTKETLEVQKGDLVTYTIRVYNEGKLDAYAKEIKDYLPSNLEFISGKVNGTDYNWTASKTDDGRTVITTSYLANRRLEKFDKGEETYRSDLDFDDVKVICKVKDTVEIKERLVNIAEISKYAYYNEEDKQVIDIQADIDSEQDNINLPTNTDWPNYNGNGTDGNYVKGQEDDDDFESVIVLYTDIGGTVWLDEIEGKQERQDGKLTENDQRLSDIVVRLYKASDLKTPIADTKTDSNGNYVFKRVSASEKYVITFEYFGQQYMPVAVTHLNSGKYTSQDSAGEENKEDREALNDKFHEIVKETAKNSNGKETLGLSYTRDEQKHTSTLIRDEKFNTATIIHANTVEFSGADAYAKHINLGLVERAQVNLGIMIDVKNAEVSINRQTATYDYNGRDEGTAMDIEAKTADLNRVYNQAIYKSDYNYRISDYNEDGKPVRVDVENELQVYITYKIKVKNYSSKPAKVSELTTYYEPEYNVVDSWYEKKTETGPVTWVTGEDTHGYKTIRTNSVKDVNIAGNEEIYVYVKMQVAKDASGGVILGEKYIVSEITGYTTDEGLIDTNSEPGNLNISNLDNYVKTYEDDTDRAPGLNLHLTDAEREMTGYVWEDSVSGKDSDGVNIGDGIKNGNEQNRNGVTTQLIELVEIDGRTYEYIWQETQTGTGKVAYMDREGKLNEGNRSKQLTVNVGEYKFTNYVPGNYIVRFKYGDTEATISLNGQDYKSTTYNKEGGSIAKDNKERRLAVMNYSIEQTNHKGEVLSGKDSNLHQELIENTWMYADTVEKINVAINTDKLENINFGLIKRPISKLVAIKEVKGIKISNKGIVYVDTADNITTGLKEVDGSYYIELDDELINGAQLEVNYSVKVYNDGEIDTLFNYFEGEDKYGSNQHAVITTTAELVYDYPEKLGYDDIAGDEWQLVTEDGRKILKDNVKTALENGATAISTEALNKPLKPGDSTDTIDITFKKIMVAGGSDDLNYSNKVEIVSRINEVGRRDEESIPGNYEPKSSANEEEPDTDNADTTIADPTGQDRIYYGLGLTAGILLIAGIVLIKKFVLRNKK